MDTPGLTRPTSGPVQTTTGAGDTPSTTGSKRTLRSAGQAEYPEGLQPAKRQKPDKGKAREALAPRQAAPSRLAGLHEPVNGTRVVLAGGGPRSTSQAEAEVDFLFEHRNDFERIQSAGGRYDIQTVVVERQDESFVGRGNAWGPNQGGGTVNTGAEGAGQDYSHRLESYIARNRAALEFTYGRDNPIALSTLISAFEGGDAPGDGRPTTARGVMTRADQGFENLQHFRMQHQRAEMEFPFYNLKVLIETSAEAIDLSDPHKPALVLADAKTKESVGTLTGDVVRLNTGTTVAKPISNPAVLAHSFVQPMDHKALGQFLESRAILDSDGRLKEGATLGLGGSGLSAYDQVLALQGSMNLFEPDPDSRTGYKVTEEARQKYAGAITFVSNTDGKWIPPRHVGKAAAWAQSVDGLAKTEELHAAFLHDKGQKVFTDWNDVVLGSVALALNITPEEIADSGLSTKDLLGVYHQRNEFHAQKLEEAAGLHGEAKDQKLAESTHTPHGAKRQAMLQTIIGLGMERDFGQAIERMEQKAPLTFTGRLGYRMHRAQLAGITEVKGDALPDNRAQFGAFNDWMSEITSSPWRVQDLAYQLFESGIATYMPGSYGNFSAQDSGDSKALQFASATGATANFDAFIVSPTFNRSSEPMIASLAGQVEPVHPQLPDLPQVTTNRRIIVQGGQPSHVEDFSLNGKGDTVPGTRSKVNVFATDVNNRESATDVAPALAYRRFAAEHLAAVGIPNAVDRVEELYAQHASRITEADFDRETETFRPNFNKLQNVSAFVRAAGTDAGRDAAKFASSFSDSVIEGLQSGSSVKARAAVIEPLLQPKLNAVNNNVDIQPTIASIDTGVGEATRKTAERSRILSGTFADEVGKREKFNPVSRDDFMKRFVDLPMHVHQAVYAEALGRALTHAQQGTTRGGQSSGEASHDWQGG